MNYNFKLYKNGTSEDNYYIPFDDIDELKTKFNNESIMEGLSDDDEEITFEEAIKDGYFCYEGDEFYIEKHEATEEELFVEEVSEILGRKFRKSNNNSWYYKGEGVEIRVSDHKRVYPANTITYLDIVISSPSDIDLDIINEYMN